MVNRILTSIVIILASTLTLMSCGDSSGGKVESPSSRAFNAIGPSSLTDTNMAIKSSFTPRFTLHENHLFAVSEGGLTAFDITNPNDPRKVGTTPLSGDIKALYSDSKRLYISTDNNAYIFGLETPSEPSQLGKFLYKGWGRVHHIIANGSTAYLTLNSAPGLPLGVETNQLFSLEISRPEQIVQSSKLPMTEPGGLGFVDNRLFVCDGPKGLVELNVEDPKTIKQVRAFADENCSDLIPLERSLVVSGTAGISQYDLVNGDLRRLSRISTGVVVTPITAPKN